MRRTFRDKVLAVSLEFDLLAEGENIMQALERLYDATSGYLLKQICPGFFVDDSLFTLTISLSTLGFPSTLFLCLSSKTLKVSL